MSAYEVYRYEPNQEVIEEFKDGGVAIIDQWICAHARSDNHCFVNCLNTKINHLLEMLYCMQICFDVLDRKVVSHLERRSRIILHCSAIFIVQ